MNFADRSRVTFVLRAAALIAVTGAGACLLLRYPPAQNSFYPRCPVYEYLHLKCPGCGATRALAALLCGQFAEAIHQNALFTLVAPFCVAYAIFCCIRWLRGETVRWVQPPPAALYGALAVAAAFMLLRNLPQIWF